MMGGPFGRPVSPDTTIDGLFTVSLGSAVGDEDELSGRPTKLTLFQNYLNPFNPITVIQYALPHECEADITVYNLLGQKVKTLVKRWEEAGYQQVIWDGRNDEAGEVASGVYFYKIKTEEFTESKKMVIIKWSFTLIWPKSKPRPCYRGYCFP